MGKRGPKPQLSRDQVLDAAMGLISRHGLDGLTMSRLARQLGTSGSGLYRYFDSKDQIIVGLQQRAIGEYADEVRERLHTLGAWAVEQGMEPETVALFRVVVAFTWYLEHATARPARHRLLDVFVSAPDPVLSEEDARVVNTGLEEALGMCAQSLEDAAQAGVLEPGSPQVRTHLLWAALHGLDHFRKRDRIQPEALQVRRLVLGMLRTMLVGFGAPPARVDQAIGAYADQGR